MTQEAYEDLTEKLFNDLSGEQNSNFSMINQLNSSIRDSKRMMNSGFLVNSDSS
jgi:hypothetical protein